MRHQCLEEDDEEGVELSDNTRAATRRPPFARASAADLAGVSRAHIAAAAQSFQLSERRRAPAAAADEADDNGATADDDDDDDAHTRAARVRFPGGPAAADPAA